LNSSAYVLLSNSFAIPKSLIFAAPYEFINIFPGFKSL